MFKKLYNIHKKVLIIIYNFLEPYKIGDVYYNRSSEGVLTVWEIAKVDMVSYNEVEFTYITLKNINGNNKLRITSALLELKFKRL